MSSPLSPNITRVVVREWLQSKNAVLDAILSALVDQITPVAQAGARDLVVSSIEPDPREGVIEEIEQVLQRVHIALHRMCANSQELPPGSLIRDELNAIIPVVTHARNWLKNRRVEVFEGDDVAAQAAAEKGGAA